MVKAATITKVYLRLNNPPIAMKQSLLVLSVLLGVSLSYAQQPLLKGKVMDSAANRPIEGITVVVLPANQAAITDERGTYQLKAGDNDTLMITGIGYERKLVAVAQLPDNANTIYLQPTGLQLNEVMIVANTAQPYRPISQVDIKLKGIENSQEILRLVPGLFIGQHAGGGKAEQVFLRGFDVDHGTDVAITVDGMPVNMVSHAHGQGYADLHFVIPELVENVNFRKGTYDPAKGNFATAGSVDLKTFSMLPRSSVKVEGGMFNTFRTVAMVNLLSEKARARQQSAYVASEYMYTKGYFDHPQNFHRLNLFGKYTGRLSNSTQLSATASTFTSRWKASGQIPDRAVADGSIGFYGAIDPNEGGETARTNANLQLVTNLANGDVFRNQVFYTKYDFTLFSNFTFFKEDPVNGDQIKQKESRHLYGYNGSYTKRSYLNAVQLTSDLGVNVRLDRTNDSELARTINRTTLSEQLALGDIKESNLAVYLNESFLLSPVFTITAGMRYDHFFSRYNDHLANAEGKANAGLISPKMGFYYQPSPQTQVYLTAGRGFHSNDTRVVVPQNGKEILPAAYGLDLGTVFKPASNLMINTALWYLFLNQEFVYVGDEGVVEPSGRTRRVGIDLSARYQPLKWLYVDMDLNLTKGRAVDEAKGEDYLPLAPAITSIGGLTLQLPSRISGSLRYRYMGNRPANEDNSTIAKGYFVTDALLNYSLGKWEVSATVQNLFNIRWKETQFDTESRLIHEADPVTEIHFTPGTPFSLRMGLAYNF